MNSQQLERHPELLFGENPLFEGLAPFIPMSKLHKALLNEPLKGIPWKEISPEYRIPLLQQLENHFFPTPETADIAYAIQMALRASLARRNPMAQTEQRRVNQIALLHADGKASLAQLQPLVCTARGGIIAAETGMGKTTLIKRALETFAPDQVTVHGPSEVCGWARLAQVNYLHVGLPSNNSRGGLLSNTLGALDALLGTDYATTLRRCRNLDQGIVLVLKQLSIHRVAMLVLDEAQPDNLDACEWEREFVLFFLAMMNLGVPILLSGHPNAFRTLRRSAQVARRFSSIGIFDLDRAKDSTSDWWATSLAPGMMRFNLCEEIADKGELLRLSREVSAGVPGFLALFWEEAQRIALSRQGIPATISPDDMSAATTSRGLEDVSKMVKFLEGDRTNDSGYSDLASPSGGTQNGASEPCSSSSETANSRALKESVAAAKVLDKLRKQLSAASKKKAAKATKDKALIEHLSPEDLRRSARTIEILAGLEQMQDDLFASRKA